MNQEFGVCNLSFTPIRESASHSSQMVSQLLFGMAYEVLSHENKWFKIKVLFDNYEGYIHRAQHSQTTEAYIECPKQVVDHMVSYGKISLLPGSELPTSSEPEYKDVMAVWPNWLDVPYLWGGLSYWGSDCSGFIQTLFKIGGYSLPRDSKDQALVGQDISWEQRKSGDLLFFGEQNITHTGLLLENDAIVHCYGKVRSDKLTQEGIVTPEFGLTHSLKAIKRLV